MWALIGQLVPEMFGLMVTPAAVIGCLVLLGSGHAVRNVVLLAGTFLVVYAALSALVLSIGQTSIGSSGSHSGVRGWISLIVGLLFLVGGVLSAVRGRRSAKRDPSPDGRTGSPPVSTGSATVSAFGSEPLASPQPAPDATSTARSNSTMGAETFSSGTSRAAVSQSPAWVQRLLDPSAGFVIIVGLVLSIANPNIAILGSALGMVLTANVDFSGQLLGIGLLLLASMLDFILPSILFAVSGSTGRERLRAATRWLIAHNHSIGIAVLVGFGLLFTGRALGQLLG